MTIAYSATRSFPVYRLSSGPVSVHLLEATPEGVGVEVQRQGREDDGESEGEGDRGMTVGLPREWQADESRK